MTLFTIITGLAGIISLFIPFIGNLSKWKAYFYYFAFCCIGITIGIVAAMSEKTISTFTTDQLLQIVFLVGILSVTTFISYLMIKRGNEVLGYGVMILVLGIYLPLNLDKLKQKDQFVTSEDFLFLSKQYERIGDYKRSANFLKEYKTQIEKSASGTQLNLIDRKINSLDSMSILDFK